MRAQREYAADMECRFTLREAYHQEPPGGSKRSRSYPEKEWESYRDTSVTGWNVMRNILENPQGHLDRGSRNIKRHLSPMYNHFNATGHNVTIDNFSIVGREDQTLSRAIKEALYIRVNNKSLNRNIGKYHLLYIWDKVLLNTSELKLK